MTYEEFKKLNLSTEDCVEILKIRQEQHKLDQEFKRLSPELQTACKETLKEFRR